MSDQEPGMMLVPEDQDTNVPMLVYMVCVASRAVVASGTELLQRSMVLLQLGYVVMPNSLGSTGVIGTMLPFNGPGMAGATPSSILQQGRAPHQDGHTSIPLTWTVP